MVALVDAINDDSKQMMPSNPASRLCVRNPLWR
jgi:hypothetical protein